MSIYKTGDKSLYNITVCQEDRNDVMVLGFNLADYLIACCTKIKCEKEAAFFMANQIMRITLKAYDHKLIDKAAAQIVDTVKKTGAKVSGPVPMPTKIEKITILRAVHKYKDSREQFEQRTHKRLIDVVAPTQKTIDALQKIDLSAGVFIDVKMK